MTLEEMAAELRSRGWKVDPPLTQGTCPHLRCYSTGSVSSAGSHTETTCFDCGKRWVFDSAPPPRIYGHAELTTGGIGFMKPRSFER
jgi:hypothetical protein